MNYSIYYQAQIEKRLTWYFVAALRSFEHLVFERTVDKDQSIFEFFVPPDLEPYFLAFMHFFQQEGIVHQLKKLPNRYRE